MIQKIRIQPLAALSRLIIDHIRLARSRHETLGWLLAVLKAGSVNLNRLAPHIDSAAQTASVHRRLERFFDEVELNDAEVARLVVAALGLQGKPWHLALDRTNWQIGKTDLNILLLSVAYDELCVPLFWGVLDKAGNSNAAARIDLMQIFKDTFQNQPVASLTGDREFIGNAPGSHGFKRPEYLTFCACAKTCISSMTITRRCPCGNTRRG